MLPDRWALLETRPMPWTDLFAMVMVDEETQSLIDGAIGVYRYKAAGLGRRNRYPWTTIAVGEYFLVGIDTSRNLKEQRRDIASKVQSATRNSPNRYDVVEECGYIKLTRVA